MLHVWPPISYKLKWTSLVMSLVYVMIHDWDSGSFKFLRSEVNFDYRKVFLHNIYFSICKNIHTSFDSYQVTYKVYFNSDILVTSVYIKMSFVGWNVVVLPSKDFQFSTCVVFLKNSEIYKCGRVTTKDTLKALSTACGLFT